MGGRVDELASIAEAQAVAAATKRVLICFFIYFIFRGRPEKEKKCSYLSLGEEGVDIHWKKEEKTTQYASAPHSHLYIFVRVYGSGSRLSINQSR